MTLRGGMGRAPREGRHVSLRTRELTVSLSIIDAGNWRSMEAANCLFTSCTWSWRSALRCFFTALFFAAVLLTTSRIHAQDFSLVPGSVIGYRAATTNQYLSSPSIAILPNGDYVASHDLFGSGFNEETSGLTTVYRSIDAGVSWTKEAEVTDMHFSSLFVYENDLYVIGVRHTGGDYLIRKSTDGGSTWTTPTDPNTGLILSAPYGGTSHNPVVHDGRIWAMTHSQASPKAMSAPVGSDLLKASSWTLSNHIPKQTSDLDGYPFADFQRWTEAQPVASPELGVVYLPKIHDARYTALIKADSATGNVSIDRDNDYAFMPGAEKKFGATYDPVTQKFWATTNPVLPEHDDDHSDIGGSTRNTAAVLSSPDLRDWKLESVFLYNPDRAFHAFQYLNFEMDGDDLAVVSRTAFDDGLGGADSYHDNNVMTFHRVEDFRNLSPTHVLVADTNNDRVVRYQTLEGMPWAPLEDFATGTYAGAALDKPLGLAQVANGDIFVGEQKVGGRILRFDSAGNFLEVVATEGVDFTGNPEALVTGPDGKLYLSVAFGGAGSDRVYRIDTDANQIDLFIDNTFDGGSKSFDDPRGLAFDDQGDLYVADRDGTDTGNASQNLVRKFDGQTGAFIENLYVINKPQGLDWDDAGDRLLLSADSPVDLFSLNAAGQSTPLYTAIDDLGIVLDLEVIGGEIVWTDFNNGRLDKLVSTDVRETVVSGLNGPGHLLEVSHPNQHTWLSSSDGRWREGQNWNWLWGIANEAEEVAVFDASGGGTVNVELLDATTVGGIRFHGSASHTIFGTAPLSIDSAATDKTIHVRAGQHTIQAPLSLPAGTTIDVAAASKLTLDSTVLVSADSLTVKGSGELSVDQTLSFNDQGGAGLTIIENAILTGSGQIGGHVTNTSGTVDPGNSPGKLTLTGNYSQLSAGELLVEIEGTSAGEFDELVVGGVATLDGALSVLLTNPGGYTPAEGHSFEFISASNGIEGMFSDFDLPTLSAGLFWAIQSDSDSVRLLIDSGTLDGDFDGDGDVDGFDFLKWQRETAGDLALWEANYGAFAFPPSAFNSGQAAVPEPTAFVSSLNVILLSCATRFICVRHLAGLR